MEAERDENHHSRELGRAPGGDPLRSTLGEKGAPVGHFETQKPATCRQNLENPARLESPLVVKESNQARAASDETGREPSGGDEPVDTRLAERAGKVGAGIVDATEKWKKNRLKNAAQHRGGNGRPDDGDAVDAELLHRNDLAENEAVGLHDRESEKGADEDPSS